MIPGIGKNVGIVAMKAISGQRKRGYERRAESGEEKLAG